MGSGSGKGGEGGWCPGAWAAEEFAWAALRRPVARTPVDLSIDDQVAILI